MSKHETRNTFYRITWEVNSLVMKFGQFMYYFERKYFTKNLYKKVAQKLVSGPFLLVKNEAQPLLENEILKQADYIGYKIAKLSMYVKISMQTSSDSVLQRVV